MCSFLQVSRSGYYEWLKRPASNRDSENKKLIAIIKEVFYKARGVYGTRRIVFSLLQLGIKTSRSRVASLMRKAGLVCKTKHKFKITTDSKHDQPIAENLLQRQFKVDAPNRCWVGDITYIPTDQGWLYLATVIDLYSRQVVGWSMASHMRVDLVNDAMNMAIGLRNPDKGLIWHTDRGSQYASESHRKILQKYGIKQSMSRKGDCWDNAVAESFFHTLKTELVNHWKFKNRSEAQNVIFEYIQVFYNRIRAHSAIFYLAPAQFELKMLK